MDWMKNEHGTRPNSPRLFHLFPQLHHFHLDPPLPLMFQYPRIRCTMNRRTIKLVEKVRVFAESPTGSCTRRTLTDLKVRSIPCDIAVGTAADGASVQLDQGDEFS